jgi:hypothetical protein
MADNGGMKNMFMLVPSQVGPLTLEVLRPGPMASRTELGQTDIALE